MKGGLTKQWIECSCGAHAVQVCSDIELTELEEVHIQEFYLAMFHYGKGKPSFWQRIKTAWRVVTTWDVYKDQVSLSPDEARKLRDFINYNLVEE